MSLDYFQNNAEKGEVENLTYDYLKRVNKGEIIPDYNYKIHYDKINSAKFGSNEKSQKLIEMAKSIENLNNKLKEKKFVDEMKNKKCEEILLENNTILDSSKDYFYFKGFLGYRRVDLGKFIEKKITIEGGREGSDEVMNQYNLATYTFYGGKIVAPVTIYGCPPPSFTGGRRRKSRRPKSTRRRTNRKAKNSRRRR